MYLPQYQHLVQIKTDVSGDGVFPKMKKQQKADLIELANISGLEPILIEHTFNYPKKHIATNLKTGERFRYC